MVHDLVCMQLTDRPSCATLRNCGFLDVRVPYSGYAVGETPRKTPSTFSFTSAEILPIKNCRIGDATGVILLTNGLVFNKWTKAQASVLALFVMATDGALMETLVELCQESNWLAVLSGRLLS